ncbi:EcoRI family type II restriction endonuclease [Microcystis sp. M113S1]|uniref:EcoRI family type II restriction endonuclease n=1 Tax=Microcystis sp. M113S1 TaxID=2771104 RepID=UPI0025847C10|nr:EcoRI family type II restriction endonuclease [Microcystis sp. M113S1]
MKTNLRSCYVTANRPRNNCASLLIKKMLDIMLEISKTSLQVLGSEIFNQITKSK